MVRKKLLLGAMLAMLALAAFPALAQEVNIEDILADASVEQASELAQLGAQSADPTFALAQGASIFQQPIFSRDTAARVDFGNQEIADVEIDIGQEFAPEQENEQEAATLAPIDIEDIEAEA